MTTISKHSNVKTFTEKLLLLLNRGGECLWHCYTPVGGAANGDAETGVECVGDAGS